MTQDEFAQKIKAKYPQYANVDNATLTQKIVAKYPQYASQIDGVSSQQPQNDFLTKAENAVTSVFPGKKIGESLGTLAVGAGQALGVVPGGAKGAMETLNTSPTVPELAGDYLKAGSTIAGAAMPFAKTLPGAIAQFGGLSAAGTLGEGLTQKKTPQEIAKETAISGAIGGAVGGGFKLLGNVIGKVAPSVLSFTSGVPKGAIEQNIENPTVAKAGQKMSIETIRGNAVKDTQKLASTLNDEYGRALDIVQSEYRSGLQKASIATTESFKKSLLDKLRQAGANEAANVVEQINPNDVNSFNQLKTVAQSAAGNYSNYPVVRDAINSATKEATDAYAKNSGKEVISQAQDALSNRTSQILRKYRVGVSTVGDTPQALFDKTPIVSKSEQGAIQEAIDTVNNWSDYTPKGLQSLAERIGALRKFSDGAVTKKSAIIGEIYNSVAGNKGVIDNFYPSLKEVRTAYHTQKGIIDEIGSVLSSTKNDPVKIQASINRLSNLYKTDKETYINVIKNLAEQSGTDYLSLLAGTEFQKTLPGFVRGLGGGGTLAAGAALLNPYLILLAPLFSPRAVGAISRNAPAVAEKTGKIGVSLVSPVAQTVTGMANK